MVLRLVVAMGAMLSVLVALPPALPQDSFERDGVTFTRQPWGRERPRPKLTAEEMKRGWVAFVPSDLDGIGPAAYPTRSEIDAELRMFACPGEYEPVTFGIYAVSALSGVSAQAGRFVGDRGAGISPGNIDIRAVRIWKQRTSWNTTRYHVLPELLEKRHEVAIPAGQLQQYWVTVKAPTPAPPGNYEGYIRLTVGEQRQHIPFTLRVLPFRLQQPAGKVWGLWPDTARWRKYTDEQILNELHDWRAHGITCSMMYPLTHGKFTLKNGRLEADLSEFERFMGLYVQSGLGGPVVASCQGIAGLAHRLLEQKADDYGPEFAALATEIVGRIEALRVEKGWPQFIYHTVDEPGGHAAVQVQARETLRIVHEAGFRTFTTADVKFTNEVLSPFLDVRCYSIGYCGRSVEQAAARRADCQEADATYWWYGTGCYTGQEGSMAVNRHYGGFLFDKTLSDGAWAWTFQRPKNSAYDDFDGAQHREQKDACITYPSPDGGPPLVPTLQWEGIREGVDDARYLATLRKAVADLRKAKGREAGVMADSIERELKAMLDGIPWLGEGRLTSSQAQVARWKIASLLFESAAVLRHDPSLVPSRARTAKAPQEVSVEYAFGGEAEDAPEAPLPVGHAPLLAQAPQIDGKLEAAWDGAFRIEDLVGQDGSKNQHRTEAWVARGQEKLYVAFRCHEDQMQDIRAAVTEHDGPVWTDDSVEVFIDANGDQRTYAHFMLNTLGTKRESWHAYKHVDPGKQRTEDHAAAEDLGWDGEWEGAAAACECGWCAEIAIPTTDNRLAPRGAWNVNLNRTRRVANGKEYGCWSPTFRGFNVPSRFGKLLMTRVTVNVTEVQLSRPTWGDNRALVRVDNTGLVADLDVRACVGEAGRPAEASEAFLLEPGTNELEVSYHLDQAGENQVTIELMPVSVWLSAESAARDAEMRKMLPRSHTQALKAYVRRAPAVPMRLQFARWLRAPMVLAARSIEVLEGHPGFDVTASLNLGRRTARGAKLTVSVVREGATLHQQTVRRIEGDSLFLNVGTAKLAPSSYELCLTLDGPRGRMESVRTPFTVIRGPWR